MGLLLLLLELVTDSCTSQLVTDSCTSLMMDSEEEEAPPKTTPRVSKKSVHVCRSETQIRMHPVLNKHVWVLVSGDLW